MTTHSAVVTGGCGFLGSHLVETLLSRGFRVAAIDNFSTASPANSNFLKQLPQAKQSLLIVEADVCQPWKTWIPEDFLGSIPPSIFHFASPASPPHYQRLGLETMWVNTVGLSQSLAAADALGGRVVFASTSEIYGDPEVSPQTEQYRGCVNTWGPRSCYDEAKRFGESLIYTHNLKHGTRHGVVRIFNTYGPRMNLSDGRVVINFLIQALSGTPLTIYGNGSQTRSFCYVDDLIRGILSFAESGHTGPMNLGNESEFTIRELVSKIQELFSDRQLSIEFQEIPIDDPKQRRPNISLARQVLQWEPRIPLNEGLVRMTEWLRETISEK